MGGGCSKKSNLRIRPPSAQSEVINEGNDPYVALGGKSHNDILAAQRLQSPDVTKHLEDRWLNHHFTKINRRQSNIRTKRRRLSHVTTADDRSLSSISEKRSGSIGSESLQPHNSLLPVADTKESNEVGPQALTQNSASRLISNQVNFFRLIEYRYGLL